MIKQQCSCLDAKKKKKVLEFISNQKTDKANVWKKEKQLKI